MTKREYKAVLRAKPVNMRRDTLTLCAVLDAAGVALLVFFLAICKLSPALGVLAIVAAVGLWASSTSLANHHNTKHPEQ